MMNPQRAKFVEHYLRTDNATEAAKAAGYSAKTAYAQGSRLLKDVEVKAALDAARKQTMGKLRLEATTVLREFMRIATADPGDLVDESGAFVGLKKLPKKLRRAISSVEIEAESEHHGKLTKVRFWSKPDALDKLGRHLGIYQRDNEQVAKTLADLVPRAAREEAEEQPEETE